jgi:cytochrome P450
MLITFVKLVIKWVLFLLILFKIILYVKYKRNCYQYRHIPGIECFFPLFLVPSLLRLFPFLKYILFENEVERELFSRPRQIWTSVHDYLHKKYGTVYKVISGRRCEIVVDNEPGLELTKMIALHSGKWFEKSQALNDVFEQLFDGSNVFSTNDYNIWKRLRTLLNPAFTDQHLKLVVPQATVLVTKQLIEKIEKRNDRRNVSDDMCSITLDVIGRSGFGMDFQCIKQLDQKKNERDNELTLSRATNILLQNIGFYFLLHFHFLRKYAKIGPLRNFANVLEYFKKRVAEVIEHRRNTRQDEVDERDVLSLLIRGTSHNAALLATSESNDTMSKDDYRESPLTDKELISNCFIMIVAGFETTSRALTFACYHLATNPHVQEKAQQLIDQRLPNLQTPTFEDYEALRYIQCIGQETLRLNPVASLIVRELKRDITVNGYAIYKKSYVIRNFRQTLRNEDYFTNANEFIPERFENPDSKIPRLALTNFGVGNRSCIGKRFAEIEMGIVLIMLLQRYNIKLSDPNYKLVEEWAVTLRPANPVYITFEKRICSAHTC